MQHLHFQCHFADGKWDHAQEIADGFPVRVTSAPEAYLSSMALFIDVARDNPAVTERRAWIEPFWSAHGFDAFIARGLLAEHALWQGDTEQALAEAQLAIDLVNEPPWGYFPSVIRPAAVALSARADRAVHARATGDDETAAAEAGRGRRSCGRSPARARRSASGPSSSSAPRAAAGWPGPRRTTAGPAATTTRRPGRRSWTRSVPITSTRQPAPSGGWPRRWPRRAAGTRPRNSGARRRRRRTSCSARPLRRALDDLARRARIGTAEQHGDGAVLAALTSREREVLRLIAAGRSNREIASVLFIAPKTASVHVSNILGKLGAASRTEAAAIAHREGLVSQPSAR